MRPELASASTPTRCSSVPNDPDAGFSANEAGIAEALLAASSVNARRAFSRRASRKMARSAARIAPRQGFWTARPRGQSASSSGSSSASAAKTVSTSSAVGSPASASFVSVSTAAAGGDGRALPGCVAVWISLSFLIDTCV